MELSQAKKFIYKDYDNKTLYMSKDFWELKNLADFTSDILAVCDTQVGEQVFEMGDTYSGEPFIFRRFMHMDSYIAFHRNYLIKVI